MRNAEILCFSFLKTEEKRYFKIFTLITEIWDRSCNISISLSIFEDIYFSCSMTISEILKQMSF